MNSIRATIPFDPVAFFLALVLAPLLGTLCSFFLILPVAALIFGGPMYLAIGTPVLLWMVGRYPPEAGRFAFAGMLGGPLWVISFAVYDAGSHGSAGAMIIVAALSMIFGALWAGTFAVLYRKLYRNPLTGQRAAL
jgi:hypothetical protein